MTVHSVVLAAVHGSLGLPGWRLFRGFTLLSPFSHSSPSLIDLLASVDVKQQKLRERETETETETERENSETLFYEYCSLGSVKNLSNN